MRGAMKAPWLRAPICAKSEILIGLASNGSPAVGLALADGSSEVVRISHNVYIAKTSKQFTSMTLQDTNGAPRTWRTP